MPDPKIKKTRRPVKKVVTNRKGKLLPNQTPLNRMTTIKKPAIKKPAADKMAKMSPAMKLKVAEAKKANLIKTNKLLVKQGRKKVTITPKKKKLSPGEQERAARMSRRLAVKARIKRNSGN